MLCVYYSRLGRFKPKKAQEKVRELLKRELQNEQYDQTKTTEKCKELATKIKKELKGP